MVETQENDFQMAARSHSEKPICRYVLHQLANFDDQNVRWGTFQGADSNGKGFNMTLSKDPAKFKMAAIFTLATYIFIHADV